VSPINGEPRPNIAELRPAGPEPWPPLVFPPHNRQSYLRLLFYREAHREPGGPLQEWLAALRREVRETATEKARQWLLERYETALKEATLEHWKDTSALDEAILVVLESEEAKKMLRRTLGPLSAENHAGVAKELKAGIREVARANWPQQLASTWAAQQVDASPPTEEQVSPYLGQAARLIWEQQERLRREAEEVAYRLRVHQWPHEWFTEWLLADAYVAVFVEEARRFVPDPSLPWRQDDIAPPKEVVLRVVLYKGEEETWDQKLKDAKAKVPQLRGRRRGPKPTLPPDEMLVHLLYRSQRRDTLQALQQKLPAHCRVHPKTLARHLWETRELIFAPDTSRE
jgi:hypothetical protein